MASRGTPAKTCRGSSLASARSTPPRTPRRGSRASAPAISAPAGASATPAAAAPSATSTGRLLESLNRSLNTVDLPNRPIFSAGDPLNTDELIVPLLFEGLEGGLHSRPEVVDFGTLTAAAPTAPVSVRLLNSEASPVVVSKVYTTERDPGLVLGPHGARGASGTLVQPGVEVEVASLAYSGAQEGRVRGRLVLLTNSTETPRVVIPYHARVLHGEVAYDPAQATFDLSAHAEGDGAAAPALVNRLVLTNRFSVPLRLLTAKVSDALFAVGDFASGTEVAPGEVGAGASESRPVRPHPFRPAQESFGLGGLGSPGSPPGRRMSARGCPLAGAH